MEALRHAIYIVRLYGAQHSTRDYHKKYPLYFLPPPKQLIINTRKARTMRNQIHILRPGHFVMLNVIRV